MSTKAVYSQSQSAVILEHRKPGARVHSLECYIPPLHTREHGYVFVTVPASTVADHPRCRRCGGPT